MKSVLILPLMLTGCMGLGGAPNMSAEQLSAAAKDKNASVACATGSGPWGKVNTVYVNVDKASLAGVASVSADAECKVTVSAGGKP
jgi:hypothetical protein